MNTGNEYQYCCVCTKQKLLLQEQGTVFDKCNLGNGTLLGSSFIV